MFSVNFVELLRTSFFTQHLQRLVLSIEAENLKVLKTMKSNKQVLIGWFVQNISRTPPAFQEQNMRNEKKYLIILHFRMFDDYLSLPVTIVWSSFYIKLSLFIRNIWNLITFLISYDNIILNFFLASVLQGQTGYFKFSKPSGFQNEAFQNIKINNRIRF